MGTGRVEALEVHEAKRATVHADPSVVAVEDALVKVPVADGAAGVGQHVELGKEARPQIEPTVEHAIRDPRLTVASGANQEGGVVHALDPPSDESRAHRPWRDPDE
jgi:hypothetical protein